MKTCGKCSHPMEDMAQACPACGAAGEAGQGLLFASRETYGRAGALAMLCGFLLVAISGVFLYFGAVGATFFIAFSPVQAVDKMTILFLSIGVVLMLTGIYVVAQAVGMAHSWIKVYPDHVETRVESLFSAQPNATVLYHRQISAVQAEGQRCLRLTADGRQIKVWCAEPARAAEAIRRQMNG